MKERAGDLSIMALADLATPMAIRVAATLGLVEHAGSGSTADELAARTSTIPVNLRRLLDFLVSVGVFDLEAATGRYRATELGLQMHPAAAQGITPLLDMNSAGGRAELAFIDLMEPLTTGASGYRHHYGQEFWADLNEYPHLRTSFDAQMNWRFQNQASDIAANFDWGRFEDIVDVGGGDGALLVEIVRARPAVHGRIVELPPTAAAGNRRFADLGLADRACAVAGSFFDPLPAGAQAYLLCDVLHDWDDAHCAMVLTRCRDAAAPHSRLIVIEPVLGHGADAATDLVMMAIFSGRERTLDGLAALITGCGFVAITSEVVSAGRMAMEFRVAV